MVWKIRSAEKARYTVHIIYDPPKNGAIKGDKYQLSVGDHRLEGVVNGKGNGPAAYVDREAALMRMHNTGTMVVDTLLGTITLEPGTYDLKLSAAGDIKNETLFRPRAVFLVPEK